MTNPEVAPLTEISARRLGPVRRYFARRPVVMDLVVMGLFALQTGVNALGSATHGSSAVTPGVRLAVAGLALPALGVALLYWRRRRPIQVTAALTVLGVACLVTVGSTGGYESGIALGLYAVAAARRPQTTWIVVGLSTAVFLGAVWLFELEVLDLAADSAGGEVVMSRNVARATTVSVTILMALLAVAVGTSVRNRRLHVAELVRRAQELRRERDQQARLARSAERTRIAREMHDVVAHSISVMIALADGAAAAVDRAPERARVAVDELASTGRTALQDMRRVLGVLDPGDGGVGRGVGDGGAGASGPTDGSPGEHLVTVIERFRTAGLPVRVSGLGELDRPDVPPGLPLAVRRIVSEALTNALRHATGTTQVDVALRSGGGSLMIEVVDSGPTVPVPDAGGAGQGLIGMRERAELHGGTVEAGRWGPGWRVRAELPWPTTERPSHRSEDAR